MNDSHEHQAGDRLLKHVARLLHEKSGKNDIAGRAGGDEFMLFLANVKEPADAERTAQEIIAKAILPLMKHTAERIKPYMRRKRAARASAAGINGCECRQVKGIRSKWSD